MAPRARKMPVPDLEGMGLAVADQVLRNAGFPGAQVRFVEAYAEADTVVGQEPPRGSLQEADQPVLVRVAKASLIRYLPTVYQPRSPDDRAFLRDFLWIFQHVLDSVTRRIDGVHELFNPHATPPEFLEWLASWFALSFDERMSDTERRRILKEAAALYRVRGTRAAMERMVKLFTGVDVTIEENRWPYRGFRVGISSSIGVDTMVLPEVSMSQTFVVRVPVSYEEAGPDTLVRLHRVIEAEKPASTNYFLQFQDRVGVSEHAPILTVGGSAIGVPEADQGNGGTGAGTDEGTDGGTGEERINA